MNYTATAKNALTIFHTKLKNEHSSPCFMTSTEIQDSKPCLTQTLLHIQDRINPYCQNVIG